MLDSVSSTNLLQNYALKHTSAQPKTEEAKVAAQPEIAPDIVKKETADATKAYVMGYVAPKPRENLQKETLDSIKTYLTEKGKIEGKDFKIENKEDKQGIYGHELVVLENNKPVKSYYFDKIGAEKETLQLVTDYLYPVGDTKGLKQIETTYGADGEFHFRTTRFEKESSPYVNDIVNFETKPFELEAKLKANGIKFVRDIEYSKDNDNSETRMTTKITAFDSKTGEIIRYEFEYDKDNDTVIQVTKNLIDNDGGIKSIIRFKDYETLYTTFIDDVKY